MHRKRNLILFAVFIIAIVCIGIWGYGQSVADNGGSDSSSTLTTVRVGYLQNGPLAIAKYRGNFVKKMKKAGYKVEFKLFKNGPAMNEALAAGSLDYAGYGDTPPVSAQAQGIKISYIGVGSDKVKESGIIVPKNSKITSLKDLKGKTIAYAKGTSSDYMLIRALASVGLTKSDVKLENLDTASASTAFAQGKIDAWATWDPYIATEQLTVGAKFLVNDKGFAYNRDYLVARTSFAKKHTKLNNTFVKYLGQEMSWANTHKAKLAKIEASMLKIKLSAAKLMVSRRNYSFGKMNSKRVKEQQQIANVMYKAGEISKKIDVSKDLLSNQK